MLLGDTTYRQWTAVFAEGSFAQTDWREGSEVRFLGPDGSGMLGRVIASRRPELVEVEYDGLVDQGRDDVASETAREYRGTREAYRLSEVDGRTRLDVTAPMGEQHYESVLGAWDAALARVKELAEGS